MKESTQFKGYWFKPLDAANKAAGILHFTPYEKIKLELIGGFEKSVDFMKKLVTNEENIESIIWGIDEDAKKITLINCQRYGKLNLSSEFPMTSYVVSFVIRGVHLEKFDQKTFFKANIELPLLTNWVNFNRIKFSMPYCNNESRWLGFDMKFRTDDFEDTSVQIDETLYLIFRHGCTLPDIHSNKSLLEENYSLELGTNKDYDFWQFISKAKRFADFLTFACGSEIDFSKILLYSKTRSQEISKEKKFFHPIELYYKQPKPSINPELHKFKDFLFEYANVEDEFPAIMKKWYEFDDSMRPIIQHLIDSINNKSTFRSVDFLIICQALEGFHRRFVNKGNLTLRTRLNQLVETFAVIINIKNIPVQIVVNSRNYYSHLYEEDGREIYKDLNLFNLTKSLRALLTCHLLYKIGLSIDKIEKIINK